VSSSTERRGRCRGVSRPPLRAEPPYVSFFPRSSPPLSAAASAFGQELLGPRGNVKGGPPPPPHPSPPPPPHPPTQKPNPPRPTTPTPPTNNNPPHKPTPPPPPPTQPPTKPPPPPPPTPPTPPHPPFLFLIFPLPLLREAETGYRSFLGPNWPGLPTPDAVLHVFLFA